MNSRIARHDTLLAFAVAGMLSGAMGASCGSKTSEAPNAPAAAAPEKHVCRGFNACKTQGGCKTGDNGCSGKNSCKSKGGCATVARHSCAGQNECKALGGCSSGDNGCKARNSCKGKGGCEVPVMR
jgi:hypothetical protein